jgi:hypothetical protein
MDPRASRAREIQASIRDALMRDWDPIGVSDVPEAQDEYDSYVGAVYRLLASGASVLAIAQHLARVEHDAMGLSTSADQLMNVAAKLRQLDISIQPA